eukprot:scaffold224591_cov34-Prasinocladus_malaysianus.AAC.1
MSDLSWKLNTHTDCNQKTDMHRSSSATIGNALALAACHHWLFGFSQFMNVYETLIRWLAHCATWRCQWPCHAAKIIFFVPRGWTGQKP